MKKLLLASSALVFAGPALGADLPVKAPVYSASGAAYDWTGFYVGGQIGYQWGTVTRAAYDADGTFHSAQPSIDSKGAIGGVHVGYNYQIGQFVAGLEGDVDATSYSGSGLDSNGGIFASGHIPVEGSIRGRVGVAWNSALLYATGGVAFATVSSHATNVTTGGTDFFNDSLVGWTAGGGVEYAVDNNWLIRAEYRYTDYGDFNDVQTNSTAGVAGGPRVSRQDATDNRVELGFSYRFDLFAPPARVVAKY